MKQSLNFSWNYLPDFKDEYLLKLPEKTHQINIPHTVKEVPYNYFPTTAYQFISTYEKIFDVDHYQKDKRYFIRFEGFMVKGRIYFNGHDLGEHVSIYIPVEIEVTDYIKGKGNRLLVILDSHEDDDYPPFGFALDYVTFGGIYREVYLVSEPQSYLRHIYVHGDSKGQVFIKYTCVGEQQDIKLEHILLDKEGNEILKTKKDFFEIDNPELWDIDHPVLYTLVTNIEVNGMKESYSTRFGFRDIEFTKTSFLLNNKPIKLVGLNRHQGYPYMGYAASKSLQESDADLLKYEVGVNIVRTSHYPQSIHFLNRCDEIGLLVVNEIPGWQHIGQSETWKKQCLLNTEMMVKEQRNHPCLIAHGVRIDESVDDHELYKETNRIAHELDPFRPTLGVRNFQGSELLEDIYGYNDFVCWNLEKGLCDPKKVKGNKKAYLVTEYMGHMDPVKATSDPQKKIMVALKHAKVINDNFKYKMAGAIGWCFVDYHTHVDFGGGDYICPHGVYDLYRNKKYTAAIYASQQDNFPVLELLTNMKPGDIPAAIYDDIWVATNCDYIELYNNGEFVGKFYPKKDKFESLPHPPILVDDLVGHTFKEQKFPPKIAGKIAKALSFAAIKGYGALTLKHKLLLAYVMKKYKVSYTELVGYWNKYVGTWGGKAKTFIFKGYKDGQLVKSVELGPSISFDLNVECQKTELVNEDTYDTTSIRVQHVDNHNMVCAYSNRIVHISVSGPIELVGPSSQALLGGQLRIYIKSKQESGEAKVIIKMDDISKEVILKVK